MHLSQTDEAGLVRSTWKKLVVFLQRLFEKCFSRPTVAVNI